MSGNVLHDRQDAACKMRDQTSALEAFANMQQKYSTILGTYGPLIQRADLGDRGVFYRLRVGPVASKNGADSLCGKLKQAGLKSCFVRPTKGPNHGTRK